MLDRLVELEDPNEIPLGVLEPGGLAGRHPWHPVLGLRHVVLLEVAQVVPILDATDTFAAGDERAVAYVVGLPGASMGGPLDIVEGSSRVAPGEIIVDRGFVRPAGVGIGDTVGCSAARPGSSACPRARRAS